MAVVIETTLGDLTVDLFTQQRPRTCLNFLKLCKIKYYNFNLFHTIQHGFIAQTGDPSGEGTGGQSIWGVTEGSDKRYFEGEKMPRIKHSVPGLLSMVSSEDGMVGSQFFFTLSSDLNSLDAQHCIIGEVTEGHDILRKMNETICDGSHRPYQDVRITHTVVLEDPFNDPTGLRAPSRSPSPSAERLAGGRIAPDEDIDDTKGKTEEEITELIEEKEAKARATILEIVGDLPDADMAPPENVLFVCKLNPVTSDDDLEIIFSRFGKINCCEVIRDKKSGDSLQYAFIEFDNAKSCEDAYFKMDNVLIDDRRIHVDFSQSVSKIKWRGKGRGVIHVDDLESNKGSQNNPSRNNQKRNSRSPKIRESSHNNRSENKSNDRFKRDLKHYRDESHQQRELHHYSSPMNKKHNHSPDSHREKPKRTNRERSPRGRRTRTPDKRRDRTSERRRERSPERRRERTPQRQRERPRERSLERRKERSPQRHKERHSETHRENSSRNRNEKLSVENRLEKRKDRTSENQREKISQDNRKNNKESSSENLTNSKNQPSSNIKDDKDKSLHIQYEQSNGAYSTNVHHNTSKERNNHNYQSSPDASKHVTSKKLQNFPDDNSKMKPSSSNINEHVIKSKKRNRVSKESNEDEDSNGIPRKKKKTNSKKHKNLTKSHKNISDSDTDSSDDSNSEKSIQKKDKKKSTILKKKRKPQSSSSSSDSTSSSSSGDSSESSSESDAKKKKSKKSKSIQRKKKRVSSSSSSTSESSSSSSGDSSSSSDSSDSEHKQKKIKSKNKKSVKEKCIKKNEKKENKGKEKK